MKFERFTKLAAAASFVGYMNSGISNPHFSDARIAEAASKSCVYTELTNLKPNEPLKHLKYMFAGDEIRFSEALSFGVNETDFKIGNVLSTASRVSFLFEKPKDSKDKRELSLTLEYDPLREKNPFRGDWYLALLFTNAYKYESGPVKKLSIQVEDLSGFMPHDTGIVEVSTQPKDSTTIFFGKDPVRLRLTFLGDVDSFNSHVMFLDEPSYLEYMQKVDRLKVDNRAVYMTSRLRMLGEANCKSSFPVYNTRFVGIDKGRSR